MKTFLLKIKQHRWIISNYILNFTLCSRLVLVPAYKSTRVNVVSFKKFQRKAESLLAKMMKCFQNWTLAFLQNVRYNTFEINDVDHEEINDHHRMILWFSKCSIIKKCKASLIKKACKIYGFLNHKYSHLKTSGWRRIETKLHRASRLQWNVYVNVLIFSKVNIIVLRFELNLFI